MVKYGDIAKDRLKPFDDDFESKVKLATKVKSNDGKTTTTLKWANGVSAKVQHKRPVNLPVVDEVSWQETLEFSQKDYSWTTEISKGLVKFTGSWKQEEKGTTMDATLQRTIGAVTAVGNTKIDAEGKFSWKANCAFAKKLNPETTMQMGYQVGSGTNMLDVSVGFLSSLFGSTMFRTDLSQHATASLLPLAFAKTPLGYSLSVGHHATHTMDVPLQDAAVVLVATKGKDFAIKTKVANFHTTPSPSVSLILKAPVQITGTWSHAPKKGHVFGVNMTL
eukprot:TRINITY_DN575_c0_g2_i3.p1 TRINITY_DN575_c0_g2~~TRINITY_DN575_c0_g2_i3.p1  ORF type:complete len:278 (+),score=145.09 TRINITY_DN575_c0_g2_i3:58-891(+)